MNPTDGDPLVVLEDQDRPLVWVDRVVPETDDRGDVVLALTMIGLFAFASGVLIGVLIAVGLR